MANNHTSQEGQEGAKVKVCSGHTRPVAHIAYSNIVDDSYWFVSSSLDGKPHLRNGQTGDWVGTFVGHKGAVWMSGINATATQMVTASGDYSAKLFNLLDGTDLYTWQHPHCVKSADWEETGGRSQVLTGCMDKKIRLFDLMNYDSEPMTWEAHTAPVKTALLHQTPDVAFSSSGDNTIKRWDLRTGAASHTLEIDDLKSLEYSKTCDALIVASKFAVTYLSTADLSIVRQHFFLEDLECAAMSPDGQVFAVGSRLKVKEFETASGDELQIHRGHHGPVFTVRYAPDSQTFTSGSEDGMVRIWPTSNVIKAAKEAEVAEVAQP